MQKDCPIYREPCHEHSCEFYIHLTGTHPQTGNPLDHWGCAISWLPILQIETSQRVNQMGAAIESFRNEMVRQNDELLRLNGDNGVRLIDG
ncbi:hypothetical protein LCGC14_2478770 [marine sediment metagenome]|uniref:Uncharacterized protein n=1 Tax=marine sediment metagenome TaxID=412755 RepID=A0A0F9BW06_9ZZZZ